MTDLLDCDNISVSNESSKLVKKLPGNMIALIDCDDSSISNKEIQKDNNNDGDSKGEKTSTKQKSKTQGVGKPMRSPSKLKKSTWDQPQNNT